MKSTGLFRKALSAVLTLTMVVGMDAGQLANNALEVFAAEPETESTSPLSDALEDIASSLETGISSANAVTLVYKGETTYYDTLQKAIEAVTDKTEADNRGSHGRLRDIIPYNCLFRAHKPCNTYR